MHAQNQPDKPAAIDAASGEVLTYRELDIRSRRVAQLWRARGLDRGDHIAILLENNLRFFELVWGALRSGLYLTTINRYLPAEDVAYIVNDCGAKSLVSSGALAKVATTLPELIPRCEHRFVIGADIPGWERYEEALHGASDALLAEELRGDAMLYSSGSTGRPKGIKRPLESISIAEGVANVPTLRGYGFDESSVYLSPAPLYHAAPYGFCIGTQSLGGTVVMMPRFDAQEALRLIEQHRVTHSQWVPTMFVRLLNLDESVRSRYDLSTHQTAIHAAAPCPVQVKAQMIDWWGPILIEYYAGTERNGSTVIYSDEWLSRPGSVGKARSGVLHICREDGAEVGAGDTGLVYFEQPEMPFAYHGDQAKTSAAQHPRHPNWSTLGDMGYVDEEGYLFLTDRKDFMIISGGVNIYPRQIEDVLIMHPSVADVAVIGVPDDEFGESVKAVVELASDAKGDGAAAERTLFEYARQTLASYMVPKTIDFTDDMPRLPTGKLYKRALLARYR